MYCIILSSKSLLKNPCDDGSLSHIISWLGFLLENFAKNFNHKIEGEKKKEKEEKKPCHPVVPPQFETWIRHLDLGTWNLQLCSGKLGFEGEEETKGRVERRRRRGAAQHQREIQDFVCNRCLHRRRAFYYGSGASLHSLPAAKMVLF